MVSSDSSGSSNESRDEKLHKKRKKKCEVSPNQDTRSRRKVSENKDTICKDSRDNKDIPKSSRDVKRGSDNSYRDKSYRERDVKGKRYDHFSRDDERQNGKRRYERSPPRRDDAYSKHRKQDERYKRFKDTNEYDRKYEEQSRPKKSSFNEARLKKEPSPEWGKPNIKEEGKPKHTEKEKPNFGLSGKLTEDTNTVNGVVIKYSEPSDARKPKRKWRLYPFKGEKALPTLYVHRQSAYLMGRDRKIADIPLDHPSCSKQHAALQFRLVSFKREGGGEGKRIRPYLIDLESANGTFVNNVKLEPRRYHELLERDVMRFGFSSREYVLLHEQSKDDSLDDDVPLTTTA